MTPQNSPAAPDRLAAAPLDLELWQPLLDLARSWGIAVAVAFVFLLGVWMMSIAAPGKMGDISRWLIAIFVGKHTRRFGISLGLIAAGIAAEMHFSPNLVTAPTQAGPGVLAGLAAIIGGAAYLTGKRHPKARRFLVSLSTVAVVVTAGGCGLGTAIGGGGA